MMAVTTACVVPAIERWGVLVTNLGATAVTVLGALYVSILVSLPQLGFFPPCGFGVTAIPHVMPR